MGSGRAAPEMRAVGAREAEPASRAGRRIEQLNERHPLLELGDRLAGEQVGFRGGEDLEPLAMEIAELGDAATIAAGVLAAAREECTIRPDGRRHEQRAAVVGPY